MTSDRTAARLALRGIFGLHRKGRGWNLYRCGVKQAIKLNLIFNPADFQAITPSYIGFFKSKQVMEILCQPDNRL